MDAEQMQQYRRRRQRSGRGSAWQPGRYRDDRRTTQEGNEDVMMPLTPGGQIDELRRLLKESEQRRQAAELKLADRERQLGTARQSIATQDHRIERMAAELARLRGAATATVIDSYALDFPNFFKSTSER
jgi:chromosome segregation ATPase